MEKVFQNSSPRDKQRLVAEYLPLVKKIARGLAKDGTIQMGGGEDDYV